MAERPPRSSGPDALAAAVAASPVLVFGAAVLHRHAQAVRGLLELLDRYIRQADVFDLFGSSIEVQIGCLQLFMAETRKPETRGSASIYANAIYLYRQAAQSRLQRYSEPVWPLPEDL